ncbi:uncharacterized protein FOMMEDRAFT_168371 [Fomitiporia mediterranea MF3/22]|uniref:uncharacterized protein n=1 Tax=Fomitiporia mediterranea (strain MF3/22) TaxID=694068 RepID=UPI0004409159|nr:uncharacterized protein FOMMEDRAFT_168371 [Fomitiporia mediterranea MF3/22]EJD03423.1 hypothetical protein FOMMEDRAFT_168371 [Fomitiporia mediterranea MF3/22]
MVRLNGRIALRSNSSDEDDSNRGIRIPRRVTFFGLLGTTMAALKLKEQWDDYRKVPTEPTANNNPLAPPAYRDDECDSESTIGLDTSINMPTRTRRKKSCCVCCGMNCGLFCKALGIVILIFTIWNTIKFAKWMMTPSPTGLESMPEFGTSLGCLDASHFYQDNKDGKFYSIAVGSEVEHDVVVAGGAVGTIVLKPSTSLADQRIKVQVNVRTSDSRLLNSVEVHTPESNPLPASKVPSTSYFQLVTPTETEGGHDCMRYDLTVFVPTNVHTLRLNAQSVAQVKFEFDESPQTLRELQLRLTDRAAANLIFPSEGLVADNVDITMHGGYLVGTLPLANSTSVNTYSSDAITKLSLITTRYSHSGTNEDVSTAHLNTVTGLGRSDFTYINDAARPVRSEHTTSERATDSELRLTYSKARFNGKIDFKARSSTMINVQSDRFGAGSDRDEWNREREHWVGDKDGGDFLKVSSRGWVGLYF